MGSVYDAMIRRAFLAIALLALLVFGWSRVRFDADPLNLLPGDVPAVRDLKWQQRHFADADETLITLHSANANIVASAAESLAAEFNQRTNLVADAQWRSGLDENPRAVAELLAWLWLNGSPSAFADLTNRLQPAALRERLVSVREELATTFSPLEIARLSRDPLGLTRIPLPSGIDKPDAPDAFHSRDGKFRVIRVRPRRPLGDYRDCARWMDEVRGVMTTWSNAQTSGKLVELGITGRPAFVAEMALGMERDMARATPCTALLVAVCFWFAHRRWRPMLWLAVLLAIIIAATLAVGGIIFGTLNAISLGFAAILLGVTADYGLVLYQQYVFTRGDASLARAAVAPGIIWSAITTAGAFGSLVFGGLPGLAELGVLVSAGVLLGAIVILKFFLPHLSASQFNEAKRDEHSFVHSDKRQSIVAVIGVVASLLILFTKGLPTLRVDADAFQPVGSEAHAAMLDINSHLSNAESGMLLSISGADVTSVARSLEKLRPVLATLKQERKVKHFLLPDSIWPSSENQLRNRPIAGVLADRLDDIKQVAREYGFRPNSLELTTDIMESWREAAAANTNALWEPRHPEVQKLLAQAGTTSDGDARAVGWIHPAISGTAFAGELEKRAVDAGLKNQVSVTSWQLVGDTVWSIVESSQERILGVMAMLVLASLWMAFRNVREVALCIGGMAAGLLGLLAVMRLADWHWNLLNLAALPLLLGLSVDYGIHTLHALRRREAGDRHAPRNTGKALLLCAATSAGAFGSLAITNNPGLASLGRVCAVGVACGWLGTVLVTPALWRLWAAKPIFVRDPNRPSRAYGATGWRVGLSIVRMIPRKLALAIGGTLGWCYGALHSTRRRIVSANLKPIDSISSKALPRKSSQVFRNFGRKLVDLMRFEAGRPVMELFDFHSDWSKIEEIRTSGGGILFVTIHLGNWELGGAVLAAKGLRPAVLSHPEPDPRLTEIRKAHRAQLGIDTIVIGDDPFAFVEVVKRLNDGGAVALLLDRPAVAKGVECELFGKPFMASIGPAELARATGCAIVPVVIPAEADGYHALVLDPIAYKRPNLREREARQQLTRQILRAFEPVLRQYPDQWYHFVPIWLTPEDGSSSR